MRGDQCLAAPLELAGHPVERFAQRGDLVVALVLDNLGIKIAGADPLGRGGQTPDWAGEALGSYNFV